MRTADPPATSPDQELQDSWLAAVLLARMALAHGRGQQYPFAAELDGADPDGNPVFRGRVLDAAALASGGLLLVQQLHTELAALRGTPVARIAEGTAHIAEAQLAGRPPDTIAADGIQLGGRRHDPSARSGAGPGSADHPRTFPASRGLPTVTTSPYTEP